MITDDDIWNLIRLPKRIVSKSPARAYREEYGQRRCDLNLQATDDSGLVFSVFVRRSVRLPGNFSIGLRYPVNEGKLTTITLTRYNGPHGETDRSADGHYALPHIHYITQEEIEAGHSQPQESHRELTNSYATFEEAMRVFFQDTATENYAQFFPELQEPRMF